ncbi:hypothetical protein AK830_g7801 [Neonectria ditissima]|uniref:Myb-like domain-containing protein n=1 Tax=Neonectria ditissima TaxID=78410 RepID=A0A0P7BDZ0_9HYPO|nr:hypothetical protein AK830_g7801 [Neonectria ditissima]
MSDTEKGEGKVLPWTEEAKYQFLLRIVAQFKEDGKQINWSRVVMPGRTTKSLQNMWTKINKQVSDLEEKHNNGNYDYPATPTKKMATPRKPRAKKSEAVVNDGDDDSEGNSASAKKPTPRKRAAASELTSSRVRICHAETDQRTPDSTPKRSVKAKIEEEDDIVSASIKSEDNDDQE